jgi:Ser/Thr protein kinase RdoA (MazF antagonist)
VPYLGDPLWKNVSNSFQTHWPVFQERLGDTLTPRLRALGNGFAARVPAILDRLSEPPVTLVHADYRLDNMFFATAPEHDPLVVIDWQLMSRGRGTYDLAYFLAQSVEPERRERIEIDAVRQYHERLCEHGVTGFSVEQCLDDYRLATLWSMVYPITAGGGMDLANERGVALATAMATRCFAAIEHLDADLLDL